MKAHIILVMAVGPGAGSLLCIHIISQSSDIMKINLKLLCFIRVATMNINVLIIFFSKLDQLVTLF